MVLMKSTRTLRILLALALLAVWQGSLLHPLRHIDANGAFVHVPGKNLQKIPGDGTAPNALCDAIAAVAACVSGLPQPAVAAIAAVDSIQSRHVVALLGAPAPAYRSQAPPALL
jgi:hypothetical protein